MVIPESPKDGVEILKEFNPEDKVAIYEAFSNAHRMGLFEVKSSPPPIELVQSVHNIISPEAREVGLSLLNDLNTFTRDGELWCRNRDEGLQACVRVAKYYWNKRQTHSEVEKKGPKQVATELQELSRAMGEVAGRLRTLSASARWWLEIIPAMDEGNPNPDDIHEDYKQWVACDAGEAFSSNDLAERLQVMAALAFRSSEEAAGVAKTEPGSKSLIKFTKTDLGLFRSCARLLMVRGKSLEHLRDIASAMYRHVTKTRPTPHWAKRQEVDARMRYESQTDPSTMEWGV